MNDIKIGDNLELHCYKHNGKINSISDKITVIDILDDYIVCGDFKTTITESDGSTHKTKEPAIMFFYKNRWFNVLAQLKKQGLFYYCNIATPYLIDEHIIKYIDYDLDLRIFPKGEYKILDKLEYQYHKKKMEYSDDLDLVINHAMKELIEVYLNHAPMFSEKQNEEYLKLYLELRKDSENGNFSS